MELEKFLKLVKQDTTLQERLREVPDEEAGVKLLLELGSEKGYSFTEADFRNFWARVQGEMKQAMKLLKLSEEELESVAGGSPVGSGTMSWEDCII